jgi:hypothetical protein
MAPSLTLDVIQRLRNARWRRTALGRLRSEQDAVDFVDDVGFAFLFGDKAVTMPTLWGAVCGAERPVPKHHDDDELGRTWQWKDTLPSRGAIYYGKLLRARPTLVSLALLPTFYALSPNYGAVDDYLDQYQAGELSAEAKNVCEVLLNEGAQATSRLRQAAGLPGGGINARRFDRALTELQTELKIVKVGISDANRWGYAYVYDLFLRQFPEVPEAARALSQDQAMDTLLTRYLRNVIAVPRAAAQRLFGWDNWNWQRVTERLAARGALVPDLRIPGQRGQWLALPLDQSAGQ